MKVCLYLLVLLSFADDAFAQSEPIRLGAGTVGGRYQLVQISQARRDQFLVDTQTGRVWNVVCSKFEGDECTFNYFQEMYVENLSPAPKTSGQKK